MRCAATTTIRSRSRRPSSTRPTRPASAISRTLAQGIPIIVAPDQSTRAVSRWTAAAAEYTPEIDNIDRGYVQTWNVAFERRLAFDISVDVAYVGAKGTDGYAALDINAPTTLGRRRSRAVRMRRSGRIIRINSWGDRLKTNYQSMQVALNKPFTHGLLFKGAYTFSKSMNESDNDGRATLTWNTPSELWRNWGPAGFDRRHNFQLGLRVSAAVAEQGQLRRRREGDHPGLAGQRRVRGLQRHAVHGDRERHGAEHAEQPADRGPGG